MFTRILWTSLFATLVSPAMASDLPPLPKHVPPIAGTAVVADAGNASKSCEWRIALTVPKIRWNVVGEVIPKSSWPVLKADVERVEINLCMGGPSQLAESRILDMQGQELDRDQVVKRLARETPVLVSVSGEMPDAYFLQLAKADSLIVVLGPRDGYPAPELLPAKREIAKKESANQGK